MSKIGELARMAINGILPQKTFDETVEAQNTRTVWYPRVHGFPRKYVYGKIPGEPLVKRERHPDGIPWPAVRSESDPDVIREHIAICSREKGSCGGLCELCRKLNNPQRMALLVRLYKDCRPLDMSGFNVGEAVDKSNVNHSATSLYLKHLAVLGLVRRERHGRIVTYIPEIVSPNPHVREIAGMIRGRWRNDPSDEAFVPIFRVMMGSFRSRVVRMLAAGGCGEVESLCECFEKKPNELLCDLDWAVRGGVLDLTSQDSTGVYRYRTPADPIARRIIELS